TGASADGTSPDAVAADASLAIAGPVNSATAARNRSSRSPGVVTQTALPTAVAGGQRYPPIDLAIAARNRPDRRHRCGRSPESGRRCGQILREEFKRGREGVQPVGTLREAVPFVAVHAKLARNALGAERGVQLLGLGQRYPGVVRAVDDEQRRGHVVDAREWRCLGQEVTVMLEAAVLALAHRPPVGRRVLEERDERRD